MSTFLGVYMRNARDNVFKFLNEEGATYTLHITPPFYILFISTYYMSDSHHPKKWFSLLQ